MRRAKWLCFGCAHPLSRHLEFIYGLHALSPPKRAKKHGCTICSCDTVETEGIPLWERQRVNGLTPT